MRILHLTDAHLGVLDNCRWWSLRGKRWLGYLSWRRRRRHLLRRAILDELCAAALASAPDRIVITGDLCQLGLGHEIEAARSWLAALAAHAPVALVPGNHDCYARDSRALVEAAWREWLHPADAAERAGPSVRECGDVILIGLDSARPTPPWSAAGTLGAAQLARLDEALARTRGRFRCVFLHHPPVPGLAARRKALRDAPALGALLVRHGVELVLHGHLHRNQLVRHGARTHIVATAAASAGSGPERASCRIFDVVGAGGGWRVRHRLATLDAAAGLRTVVEEDWHFPALPGASATDA